MPTRSDGRIRHTIVFTLARESRCEGGDGALDGLARLGSIPHFEAVATAAM
jgi:hypothetical protein